MTTTPPVPEPDLKDWTWVIDNPCPDCGFDGSSVRRDEVPALTRRYAGRLQTALARTGADVRPAPEVWSATEYGCHVRDVCGLFASRLRLMLTEDDPLFDNWDQDVTALETRYWVQRPAAVAEQIGVAADRIAHAFAAVRDDEWQRPGRRTNGSVFTVDTFARYFLHDLAHHAWDVREPDGR